MLAHCDTCTTPYPEDLPGCPNCGATASHTNDDPRGGCPHCEEAVMAKNTVHGGPSNALVEPEPEVADAGPAPEPEPEAAEAPAPPPPPAAPAKAAKK